MIPKCPHSDTAICPIDEAGHRTQCFCRDCGETIGYPPPSIVRDPFEISIDRSTDMLNRLYANTHGWKPRTTEVQR